jgi:hypothetical protein
MVAAFKRSSWKIKYFSNIVNSEAIKPYDSVIEKLRKCKDQLSGRLRMGSSECGMGNGIKSGQP